MPGCGSAMVVLSWSSPRLLHHTAAARKIHLSRLFTFLQPPLKILPTGNLNVGDPFVRSLSQIPIPETWSWVFGLTIVALILWISRRKQSQRRARGLEAGSLAAIWGQNIFLRVLILGTIGTMNSYRSVPLLVVLVLGLTAIVGWIITSTPFGRSIFAVGGNAESARRVGMNVRRIRVTAFGIVGLLAAIGGAIGASRYGSVAYTAFAGGSLLLESTGAAVIGGTSLFGGRGSVWNAIFGALEIASLGNGLDLSGAGAADKLMFSGAILTLAVANDAVTRSSVDQRR